MPGQDTDEILVAGADGAVYVAPVGTAMPAIPTGSTGLGWVDLGLVNDDGVGFTDAKTMEDYSVWQLFYPAKKTIVGRDAMFKFVLAQWNGRTVVFAFGGGTILPVSGHAGVSRYVPPDPGAIDDRALMVRWGDGTYHYQLGMFRGLVSENVETQLTKSKPAELPITFALIGQDGVDAYELVTDNPAFAS
jgi:hypothetical protein